MKAMFNRSADRRYDARESPAITSPRGARCRPGRINSNAGWARRKGAQVSNDLPSPRGAELEGENRLPSTVTPEIRSMMGGTLDDKSNSVGTFSPCAPSGSLSTIWELHPREHGRPPGQVVMKAGYAV